MTFEPSDDVSRPGGPRGWLLVVAGLGVAAAAFYSCGDGVGTLRQLTGDGDGDGGFAGDPDAGGDVDATTGDAGDGDTVTGDGDASGARGWKLPETAPDERVTVTSERIGNREATVPPQCYTKTEGVHNPCYVCHQAYDDGETRLNELNDGALQGSYNFSDIGVDNHWKNLFVDRQSWVDSISDDDIRAYVDADNYSDLAPRLRAAGFTGFIPDLKGYAEGADAFDERGLARDGSHWVAYTYKPFPGTFWPTNGATDDVLVRLPRAFRELHGAFDVDVYYVNLTRIELHLKQLDAASIWPIDETRIGADVDGDGKLGEATVVDAAGAYVGDASDIVPQFQQFPTGTELMHSVRYLGVDDDGGVYLPRRMKELRYMTKVNALPRTTITARYANERKEKRLGELPNPLFRGDRGFDNGLGWYIQGFVEDYDGSLRPQSFEEGLFCVGCHKAIGTTIDSTFSFVRKVTGVGGFGYIDLTNMPDAPNINEPGGEILNYLARVGGGSEFRANPEMRQRWFKEDGTVDEAKVRAADVATLITPSAARALTLNKAYTHVVRHQAFIFGRDPTAAPVQNVHEAVDASTMPLKGDYRHYGWDIRLDWKSAQATR